MTIYLMITLLAIAAIGSGIVAFAFQQLTHMKLQSTYHLFQYLEKSGVYSRERFDCLKKQEVDILSEDGLRLCGYVIETDPSSKQWVIIVHGYTVSMLISTQYIDLFQREGFNILLIDQRRHGNSQGKYTTYGFYEKYDVAAWVRWLLHNYGTDCSIGLHGQSLGGATVLEYLSIAHSNIKFVIADCPFSDLTQLLHHQARTIYKLPPYPLLPIVNKLLKRKAGFTMEQVSPLQAVEHCHLPVLFIHGTKDNYVPTYMSEQLYKRKPGQRSLLLVDGAIHGNAYAVAPKEYSEAVRILIHQALKEEAVPALTTIPIEFTTSTEPAVLPLST
ncbi:alpha/beta hydrolase [Paenibacillus sp. GM2]|uniref:alpha/beta hydrolase n=1 Tax=Paenibacillus sp. GM2 TaxID=1622070 RepID=UPI000839993E|nr:alpha/beta hydrolase [Paenibacillus sp. GM2]